MCLIIFLDRAARGVEGALPGTCPCRCRRPRPPPSLPIRRRRGSPGRRLSWAAAARYAAKQARLYAARHVAKQARLYQDSTRCRKDARETREWAWGRREASRQTLLNRTRGAAPVRLPLSNPRVQRPSARIRVKPCLLCGEPAGTLPDVCGVHGLSISCAECCASPATCSRSQPSACQGQKKPRRFHRPGQVYRSPPRRELHGADPGFRRRPAPKREGPAHGRPLLRLLSCRGTNG